MDKSEGHFRLRFDVLLCIRQMSNIAFTINFPFLEHHFHPVTGLVSWSLVWHLGHWSGILVTGLASWSLVWHLGRRSHPVTVSITVLWLKALTVMFDPV